MPTKSRFIVSARSTIMSMMRINAIFLLGSLRRGFQCNKSQQGDKYKKRALSFNSKKEKGPWAVTYGRQSISMLDGKGIKNKRKETTRHSKCVSTYGLLETMIAQ